MKPSLRAPGEAGGFEIGVAELGASWLSCQVPLQGGRREVLLAPADPWRQSAEGAYLGSTVGRVANRIAGAAFELEGRRHLLPANEGRHHLHGGPEGLHRRRWHRVQADRETVRFSLVSPDGDQGYPGRLELQVAYRVDVARRAVQIEFSAETDAITPVSLTHHAYFNLDGRASDVRGHRLRVAAGALLPVDAELIPLEHPMPVAGTPLDLRRLQTLPTAPDSHAQLALAHGFDHCYVLDDACAAMRSAAAELVAADGRLGLRLFTDQPGLQVYTGQHLGGHAGRDGKPLAAHAGIALEPQAFPDSVNRPGWRAGVLLAPGQRWLRRSEIVFFEP